MGPLLRELEFVNNRDSDRVSAYGYQMEMVTLVFHGFADTFKNRI